MNKEKEIRRLLGILQEFSITELRTLRKQLLSKKTRINVPKADLQKFVEQNRSTKSIARYYKVSPRTITRRIKKYGLTGLRPKGKKPVIKKPKVRKSREAWITTKKYFDDLYKTYYFINIRYPAVRYINPKTLICSNTRSNPKEKFTTVGIYYVVEQSPFAIQIMTADSRIVEVNDAYEKLWGITMEDLSKYNILLYSIRISSAWLNFNSPTQKNTHKRWPQRF